MPDVSNVAICNLALTSLGANRITALDQDIKPARECNAIYTLIRDAALRVHPWNFAIKRVELTDEDTEPDMTEDGMTVTYTKPDDYLRVIKTSDDDATIKVEGDKILSDTSSLKMKYIAKISDPTKFDSLFIEAFAALLAANLAYAITSSRSMEAQKFEIFKEKIKEARSIDGQEGTPEEITQDEWILARSE